MQNLSKEQVKTILSNAPAGSDYGKIVQGLADKGYVLEGYNDQPAPKQDGFVQALAKDAVGTLVAKPVMRGTELATRVFAPNSMAAEGFGQMADRGESQTANIPLIGDIEVGQAKEFGEGGGRELASDALKTASYLFPYGKAAKAITGATGSKIAGNVASGVAGGYSADVGYNLADENKTIGESFIPGLGTALGAAIPLAGPVVRASGRGVAKAGEKLVDAVIPASTREAQILQTYQAKNPFFQRVRDILSGVDNSPTTAGKTAVRTKAGQTFSGLFGTKSQIGVQARRAAESLWNDVISPRLKASEQAVDLDGFFAKVQDDIITNNPEVSRQNALLKALDSFKEEYAGMRVVSLEKLQKLKEGWAEFIPEKAYRGENISGAANQVRKLLANESRQTIYSQLGDDIRQAYFDYGNLQGLQKMGIVSMTGQKLKGGTGGFISELLSQSVTPIGTVGGQVIYRLGKGMEFIGELGAKNLAEALGIKGLKFPGDKLIDDVQKRLQEFKAPRKTQINQSPTNAKSIAISDTIPQTSKKVKGETPSKLPEDTLESIQRMATEYEKEFSQKVSTIAKNIGLDVEHGGAKSIEGIKRKAPEYGGELRKIPDMNRSAFLVKSTKDIRATAERVIDEAKKQFGGTARIKYDLSPGKYQKVLVNVETPVGLGEMQITSKKLWNAKKNGGDALYRLSRDKATPKEVAELLTDRGNEIYSFVKKSPLRKASKASNEGGFTYDVIRDVDFAGTPHISVSPYPERTIVYKGATSVKHLADFLEKNIDLLQKKGYAMGGWYNKATKTTYLDVVIPVNKKFANLAEELGNKSNQIAGFDLEDFVEIKYKGTGTTDNVASLKERQALVDKILEGLLDI